MRILLIHQAFCGPNDPGGTRHYELAQRLIAAGHALTVITSPDSYLTGERKSLQTSASGIQIRFAPTAKGLHRSYTRRVLSFLSFACSSVIKALQMEPPDVIVGTSPPIFQAFSAWMVAAVYRRPFVLEIRDLWPDFAIDLGLLRNRILISLAQSLEQFLYRRSSHIVVNSPAYAEELMKKGVSNEKITVVANGVDISYFEPEDRGEDFRRKFQIEEKFVVMYAGAVGYANDLDCLLRAACRLREHREIVFAIVGDGKELSRLRQRADAERLHNVRFIPAQPKRSMPKVLAAANVCVAMLRNIPMFRTTYPNKVFDYMAAGRPTLLAVDGVIREVVEKSGGGLFVPPGEDRSLVEAILKLYHSPDLREQMGRSARKYVTENFDRDRQAHQFAAVLEGVCPSEAARIAEQVRLS